MDIWIQKISAIPLNLIDREIGSQELVNNPATRVTLFKPLKISTPILGSSCMIDNNGLHILGSFSTDFTGSKPTDNADFSAFQKSFTEQIKTYFPGLPANNGTFMVLSKSALAQVFDAAFNGEKIDVSYENNNVVSEKIDKNLKIDLDEINCGSINPPCPQLHIVPDCSCTVNFHCRGGILGEGCRIAEAAAKATWYSSVYPTCMAGRASQIAINGQILAACEAAKLSAQGGCEIVKKSLTVVLTSKVSIGDVHLTVASSANISGSISNINFDNDLSALNLSFSANVNVPINTTFGFTPEGPVGYLACVVKFDHPYNVNVSAIKPLTPERITTVFDSSINNSLSIKIQTAPTDFDIKIDPTPFSLLNRDIAVLIDCPFIGKLTGIADIAKGFKDVFSDGNFSNPVINAIFNGKYDFTLKGETLNLPLKPVQVKLLENKIQLNPINESTYIGFIRTK